MAKIGFVGFGEVNTPVDVIIRKCAAAEQALRNEGLDLVSVYPVADDYPSKVTDIHYSPNNIFSTSCLALSNPLFASFCKDFASLIVSNT